MSETKSAAEIATEEKAVADKLEQVKETAKAAPPQTVKDEKTIEVEIAHLENKLHELRELKKSAGKPSAPSATPRPRSFFKDYLSPVIGQDEDEA
jgi:hypothetical protein